MRLLKHLSFLALAVTSSVLVLACDSSEVEVTTDGSNNPTPSGSDVSRELGVLAHRLVFAYMSDKAWGFFGATCEKWIQDDYQWESSMSEQLNDGRIKVTYLRNEDRFLGPEQLIFYVNIDTNEVEGDNEPETDTGRLGVAEGCDQW